MREGMITGWLGVYLVDGMGVYDDDNLLRLSGEAICLGAS
jgi:hypothetical protein